MEKKTGVFEKGRGEREESLSLPVFLFSFFLFSFFSTSFFFPFPPSATFSFFFGISGLVCGFLFVIFFSLLFLAGGIL